MAKRGSSAVNISLQKNKPREFLLLVLSGVFVSSLLLFLRCYCLFGGGSCGFGSLIAIFRGFFAHFLYALLGVGV